MAGAIQLKPPPADLDRRDLDVVMVSPGSLCRVSRFATGEPYFGRTGDCRFDDCGADLAMRFGTCYLGFDLTVAFAESVLHNLEPDVAGFAVPATEIAARYALSFKPVRKGGMLRLAKLYGTALLRIGANGELSGTPDYTLPQAWSKALVAHPAQVDGFLYMSRRVNDTLAVVLIERHPAHGLPIRMDQHVPLHHHADYLAAVRSLAVTVT